MAQKPSLLGRAIAAVVLTIGFYAMALAIVGVLLFLVYADYRFANRIHPKLVLISLAGSILILSAIWPRRDRFEAPGILVDGKTQPQLFAKIKSIAERTAQKMPDEVYVVPEMNAFVTERGGFLGLHSKRVMGIGFPLLHLLSQAECEAVLVHEFGHFHGGDTRLGGWIYKTRAAIIRSVRTLGGREILQAFFRGYAILFLRVTQAISRAQEFHADRLAAELSGRQAVANGLTRLYGEGAAYDMFMQEEMYAVLKAGYKPSWIQGYQDFLQHPEIREKVDALVAEQTQADQTDPYDSHPSLKARLEALQDLPLHDTPEQAALAITWLEATQELEAQLLRFMFAAIYDQLQPVAWDEISQKVYLPLWKEKIKPYQDLLSQVNLGKLKDYFQEPKAMIERVMRTIPEPMEQSDLVRMVLSLTTFAVILALHQQGWRLDIPLGGTVRLSKGKESLKPFQQMIQVATNDKAAEEWTAWCVQQNLQNVRL